MNESGYFMNPTWFWPVIGCALILWAIFIWKEFGSSGRKRFWIKVGISFLGIVALAMIALKPGSYTLKNQSRGAILTPGYQQVQLDSLRESYPKLQMLQYSPAINLTDLTIAFDSVFVLGTGLREFDLWQLNHVNSIYLGGNITEGILQLDYEDEKSVGDSLNVIGIYKAPKNGHRLVLKTSGGKIVDSLRFNKSNTQKFKLGVDLKVAGDFLYTLEEQDSLGVIFSQGKIPVHVKKKIPLKILILNSAPNFETKYLKNYLAEKGQQVLVRNQVTRGKFTYEYLNLSRKQINPYNEKELRDFDLLILDNSTLKSLNKNNLAVLKNAIQQNGLGIFIQTDASFFQTSQKLTHLKFERDRENRFIFPRFPEQNFIKLPYRFNLAFGIEPVFRSNEKKISVYQQDGKGRVGASVLQDTYRLILDGKNMEYAYVWSAIIQKLAKKKEQKSQWEIQKFPIYVDEPLHFILRTSLNEPEVKNDSGGIIPLKQNPDLPYFWSGVTYPSKTGWGKLRISQDTLNDQIFYVQDTTQFRSLTAVNTMHSNKIYFNQNKIETTADYVFRPFEPLWFYLIFLACMAYLWLEPKVYGD